VSKLESFLTMQLETTQAFERKMREELEDVGIERFNREHLELLAAFLKFHALLERLNLEHPDETAWREVAETLAFLRSYATRHLEAEEAVLERAGFNGLPYHKIQHAIFNQRLDAYDKALNSHDASKILGVKYNLFNWFFNHINKEDVKYRELLQGQAL